MGRQVVAVQQVLDAGRDGAARRELVAADQVERGAARHVARAAVLLGDIAAGGELRVAELVSNPANSNPAIVVSSQAAAAGVQGFSRIMSTGEQIWATVRNGTIINAGVNAAKDAR